MPLISFLVALLTAELRENSTVWIAAPKFVGVGYRKGVSPEWRLVKGMFRWFLSALAVAFHNHFVSRFGEQAKVFGATFHNARFGAVGAVQ